MSSIGLFIAILTAPIKKVVDFVRGCSHKNGVAQIETRTPE